MSDISTSVPRETQDRLQAYIELLRRWNSTLNLVSKADLLGDLHGRHIEQSIAMIPLIPPGATRFIDLGSGGGFPAIPIAIATGMHVDLVESDHRKAAFLETALATLELSGRVWIERIEASAVLPARCVTARALAALPQLLAYTKPLLEPGGVALFLKGDRLEQEINDAQNNWNFQADLTDLPTKGSRILKISRLEPRYDISR